MGFLFNIYSGHAAPLLAANSSSGLQTTSLQIPAVGSSVSLDSFTLQAQEPLASPQAVTTQAAWHEEPVTWGKENAVPLVCALAVLSGLALFGFRRYLFPSLFAKSPDKPADHWQESYPENISEADLTDSMRDIGKGRDQKARIKPGSQTAMKIGRALMRFRLPGTSLPESVRTKAPANDASPDPSAAVEEAPAGVNPRQKVIPPESPEAQQLGRMMSGEEEAVAPALPQEPEPVEQGDRPSTVPPGSEATSMRLADVKEMRFVKEFQLGRYNRHFQPFDEDKPIEDGESVADLRVVHWLHGIAERQAILRQDEQGFFWIRNLAANYEADQGYVMDPNIPTRVRRQGVDHHVPNDYFARLEVGDLIYLDAWTVVPGASNLKKKKPVDFEIEVGEGGFRPRNRELFYKSALWLEDNPALRSETRSSLLEIPYNETITNLLLDYKPDAEPALLEHVLKRIEKEKRDIQHALAEHQAETAADRSDSAEVKLLQDGLHALKDLAAVVKRDLGHELAAEDADVRFNTGRNDMMGSILLRLRLLRNYREDRVEDYFRHQFYKEPDTLLEFYDFYWQRPTGVRRRLLDAVLRVWEGLEVVDRELVWTIHRQRCAALPPVYLNLVMALLLKLSRDAENFESINSTQLAQLIQWELKPQLEIARYLMTHEAWRGESRLIVNNAREMALVGETYRALNDSLRHDLAAASPDYNELTDAGKWPEKYLEGYFTIRLSDYMRALYPPEQRPFMFRRSRSDDDYLVEDKGILFGFLTAYEDNFVETSSKAELIHIMKLSLEEVGGMKVLGSGDMEADMIADVERRLRRWLEAEQPEKGDLNKTVVMGSLLPETKREGGTGRPPAPEPVAEDERVTLDRVVPVAQALQQPFDPKKTLPSYSHAEAVAPKPTGDAEKPQRVIKRRKRRIKFD